MAFRKGQSGNPAGKPKGARNKASGEIRDMAKRLLEDPEYQESLRRRLEAGEASHMETLLHHYAYGKPKETMELEVPEGIQFVARFTGDAA